MLLIKTKYQGNKNSKLEELSQDNKSMARARSHISVAKRDSHQRLKAQKNSTAVKSCANCHRQLESHRDVPRPLQIALPQEMMENKAGILYLRQHNDAILLGEL